MPRKLRAPKLRHDVSVSVALRHFLTWGDYTAACDLAKTHGTSAWEILLRDEKHVTAWRLIEDEALADWIAKCPGTRPASWWQWSAPAVRVVFGRFRTVEGRDRCWGTGAPYGEPIDHDDLPRIEAQAAALDRLDLWLPDERVRVPAAAFDSEAWPWLFECPPYDDEEETD